LGKGKRQDARNNERNMHSLSARLQTRPTDHTHQQPTDAQERQDKQAQVKLIFQKDNDLFWIGQIVEDQTIQAAFKLDPEEYFRQRNQQCHGQYDERTNAQPALAAQSEHRDHARRQPESLQIIDHAGGKAGQARGRRDGWVKHQQHSAQAAADDQPGD